MQQARHGVLVDGVPDQERSQHVAEAVRTDEHWGVDGRLFDLHGKDPGERAAPWRAAVKIDHAAPLRDGRRRACGAAPPTDAMCRCADKKLAGGNFSDSRTIHTWLGHRPPDAWLGRTDGRAMYASSLERDNSDWNVSSASMGAVASEPEVSRSAREGAPHQSHRGPDDGRGGFHRSPDDGRGGQTLARFGAVEVQPGHHGVRPGGEDRDATTVRLQYVIQVHQEGAARNALPVSPSERAKRAERSPTRLHGFGRFCPPPNRRN